MAGHSTHQRNAAPCGARPPCAQRRGVLLLVVLSMLTLFLMLGVAYLVTATRARETARAYARLVTGGDDARVPHAQLLDRIMLKALRGGGQAPTATGATLPSGAIVFESLLADKYGYNNSSTTIGTISATASGVSISGPIVICSITTGTSLAPTDLNGRVLTFVQPGRAATSHRIIRAQASSGVTNAPTTSFALALDKPFQAGPFTIPAAGRVIINGREFAGDKSSSPLTSNSNEAWDGFDDHNRFLAQITGSGVSSSTVTRGSYISGSNAVALTGTTDYDSDLIPDDADNDNDGVTDGVFLDFGIPDASDANGGAVQIRASVLIVDLDSRYNVNAHDSLSRIVYSTTSNYFPSTKVINAWGITSGTLATFMPNPSGVPVGSGYGPAEISGGQNKIFTGTGAYQSTEDPATFTLAGGSTGREVGKRPTGSRYSVYSTGATPNPTPLLDSLEGRYGSEKQYDSTRTSWTGLNRALSYGSTATTSASAFFKFARPGQALVDDAASQFSDRRGAPGAGVSYGIPTQWWAAETDYTVVTAASFLQTLDWTSPYASAALNPRGVFNSPPDLHGRMKTATKVTGTAPVPQLVFAKPEWGSDSLIDLETRDDPYEICLDTRDGRGGLLHDPATNGTGAATSAAVDDPYSPAEFEPVLRPYDRDTNILSPRLVTMLGSAAEEARFKVTTDSWDSTAIAGGDSTSGAAAKLFNWLSGFATSGNLYGATPLDGIIGGEIARGERFDLNRALQESGTANSGTYTPTVSTNLYYRQRQAYFKDLYTLVVALNPGADRGTLAQWVANAVEFRDADSVMTPFEYDTNPANGWSPDGSVSTASESERAVVFGTERPEVLIQEAFAWRNTASGSAGMAITLHRPWNAKAISPSWYAATTAAGVPAGIIDAEPCDVALDTRASGTSGRPLNQIDLGKKAGPTVSNGTNAAYNDVSGTTYPIWRLRIVDSSGSTTLQTVRFDTGTAGANEVIDSTVAATKTGDSKAKLAADSTLTLLSGTTITTGTVSPLPSTLGTVTIAASGSTRTFTGLSLPGTGTSGTVLLERLSIPSIALTSSNAAQSAIWNSAALSATGTSPAVWITVDSCPVSVVETGTVTSPTVFTGTSTARTPGSLFWKPATAAQPLAGATVTIPSTVATSGTTAWFPWPNRPFVSSAELMLVPRGKPLEMLQNYSALPAAVASYGIPVTPLDLIFDAVHVPTRFSKIHTTTTVDTSANTGIDNNFTTVNQLSSFREPGRVNLNTVMSDEVWNAVVLGPLSGTTGTSGSTGLPTRSEANFSGTSPDPAKSLVKMLSLMSTGSQPVNDKNQAGVLPTDLNPLHSLYTATRLANTVTPRSNVFAVWITLRESMKGDPDSVKYHRAFYIIDRSIPVGFEDGADYNVLNCVRLRRIIE